MMKRRPLLAASALATLLCAEAVAAENVVASIKPVHSLVAAVMEGAGTPELLVKGAGSPHTYAMRPSEAGMLEDAQVVFWVGPELEIFLDDALDSLAGDARVVALAEAPGATLLDQREGGPFEAHSHDDHDGHQDEHAHAEGEEHHAHEDEHGDHAGHDNHDDRHAHAGEEEHHAAHDDHDEDHAHEEEHGGHAGHDHAHGGFDLHLWLDPENAREMTRQIAATLAQADPDNAAIYERNADALDARFDALIAETNEKLADVRHKPFVVFHDAYQYFEQRFDIPAAGSITVSPDALPGARRLGEIQDKITELGAACVFSEPQFEPKLVNVVTEGTGAHSGVLDPLGADIEDGPDLYFTLVGNMADSLSGCLSDGA
ncbi:zinc ABC transporter substrate-binding protein [Nitratireductor sp. GCM10026969]|uniref:zinc ABC transporter substrate-binding protein n=1 Tax=Nitratireductor sp. GCM10026969 TaxID=3252645 RepID=UPI00361008ED